jgi:predicted CoA-binding protein
MTGVETAVPAETETTTDTRWRPPNAGERLRILRRARSVAIVGMSESSYRASHFVATYLLSSSTDYDVYFVNPNGGSAFGRPFHPSLDALPVVPDIVDVFRRTDDLPVVAEEAIAAGAPVLWFQLGLRHDDAAQRAHDAGLSVVQNRCLKIEHARFRGGLHLAGFDTGVINSRRHGVF